MISLSALYSVYIISRKNFIRSPSSMAISWSYVHQNFDFCEKAVIPPFFISHLFVVRIIFEKMQFLFIHIVFFITLVISPGYCLVYPPRLSAQAIHLGYPQGYPPSQSHLMLPNLTNQVIRLSNGDLQCK